MCATVCPSGALFYGTLEEVRAQRPQSRPLNHFHFGAQPIVTKVQMLVPRQRPTQHLDVLSAMDLAAPALSLSVLDDVLYSGTEEA
jgi:hypothetical protein